VISCIQVTAYEDGHVGGKFIHCVKHHPELPVLASGVCIAFEMCVHEADRIVCCGSRSAKNDGKDRTKSKAIIPDPTQGSIVLRYGVPKKTSKKNGQLAAKNMRPSVFSGDILYLNA